MSNNNIFILGIDLEGVNEDLVGSGLNLDKDRVTEIGAVMWDWNKSQPVQIYSELIDEPDRLPISEELKELTGLDDEILSKWGAKGEQIRIKLAQLNELIEKADYLMAHNGKGYDIPMLDAMFNRYGMKMAEKTWIDTLTDIEYPTKIKNRSMAMLEYEHGFINPFSHRAVTDVLTMLKIASQYSIERMIQLAQSPIVKIIAQLKAPNWKNKQEVETFNQVKHKVAQSKFRWSPQEKIWYKEVHQIHIDEGLVNYDFEWNIDKSL